MISIENLEDLQRDLATLNRGLRDLRKELATEYAPRSEQVRLRRIALAAVAVALVVGTFVNTIAIQQISHREAVHAAERCADPRGNAALRSQWRRVAELIRRTNLKPSNPQYLPPKDAGKQFSQSYTDAIREAGAPPNCLGGK